MRSWPTAALCALLAACGSPIVGAECRDGFSRCEGVCVDLERDSDHCGACGDGCGAFTCEARECTSELRPDAGIDAGSNDAGSTDSGPGDADGSSDEMDGGLGEAGSTPIGSGPFLPDGGLMFPDPDVDDGCPIGRTECNGVCFDLQTSTSHCGMCSNACAADQFCALGVCEDICEEPLELCGDLCLDLSSDPEHCGSCTNVCASGICEDGACADALPGNVVVIGHDYERSTESSRNVAANTLELVDGEPVRVAVYRGKATNVSVQGVLAALATSRADFSTIEVSAAQLSAALIEAQMVVIHAQRGATDDELNELGVRWGLSLAQFVARGGSIVLFDAPSDNNAGTYQILSPSGLFAAGARAAVASSARLSVVEPGNTVGSATVSPYQSSRNTVAFRAIESEGTVIVQTPDGDAVVVHRVIVP
jgi:hypothetical protein